MTPFADTQVQLRYDGYAAQVRDALLAIRERLFAVAAADPAIGPLTEALRWGEPAYLTEATKSGTTVRLAPFEGDKAGFFVHCGTTLIEDFRHAHGDALTYSKNRAVVFDPAAPPAMDIIDGCARRAFTYHLKTKAA